MLHTNYTPGYIVDEMSESRRACPVVSTRPASGSTSSGVERMKLSAYETLFQDIVERTDPRMAAAGRHFMECDGITTLTRLIGRRDRSPEHQIADDARKPKKSLHRNAFPLARFLSLHLANQPTRLGVALGRRMIFDKLVDGRSVSASPPSSSSRQSVKRRPRIRSSWHVSPLLFRLIVAFTKRPAPTGLVGGRFLGTGRNETRVYTFDDVAREHPKMRRLCMHLYSSQIEPSCFAGRDAEHVVRIMEASITNLPVPFLSEIALKDVVDPDEAGTEIHLHQRIHRWFTEVHCIHLTCLHPHVHFLHLEEGGGPVQDGHRLLVTRLLRGDVHHLSLREEELMNLSIAVLQGLEIFHAHHYLHMDIKPENILWGLDNATGQGHRLNFCLSDYNLVMSEASVQQYLRPDDGGGFQSLSHGTEGFKSPLLMADDLKGSSYREFEYVATKSRAFQGNAIPVWREYFDRSRSATTMAKVDLHSLALTLVQLARPHGQDKAEALRLMRGPFGKFVARLMFFRPHDFLTASQALVHLTERNPAAAQAASSLKRVHPPLASAPA